MLDAAGNLVVADSANQRIRRISPSGVITTIAGQGMEAFAGDNASAVLASLDSPRSVAVSPGGLVTLADSGNQRVRQIDALPAPGPDIHTIVGIGTMTPGALLLSGPSVEPYGSGAMTATLSTATNATGSVTFLDTSGGTTVTVGVVGLSADAASLSTGTLATGAHSMVAVYAGDATHGAAQSQALALTVMPLTVTATANPVAILYGQAIPALGGVLSGVLAQDAGKVAAVFTTSAGALSPVGVYPIAATLTGSAAGNYSLGAAAGSVSIAQAPTLTTLLASTNNPGLGSALSFTMRTASTTSGVPTGSVTVFDGTTVLGVVPLAGGAAAFSTNTLALGTHSLSAAYSGDGNFLASTSAIAMVTVGAAQDFTLAATGATAQAVPAGSAATYSFSVGMVGAAMASPITLAVQGAPLGATPSFSPNYIPPGGAVTSFTLTIQTPLAGMEEPTRPLAPRGSGPGWLAVLVLPVMGFLRKGRGRFRSMMLLGLGAFCVLLVTGCGDRVNTAPELAGATSYTLTVTGTATSAAGTALVHSANVTLQVL
jgi:hypothetical protein